MSIPWMNSMPVHRKKLRVKNMFVKQGRAIRDEDKETEGLLEEVLRT